MKVTIRYFDGCPNWETAVERMRQALGDRGAELGKERIDSDEEARRLGFRGSPTILIDGVDAFPGGDIPIGLTCRLYETEAGVEGSPSLLQLRSVIRAIIERNK